MDKAVEILRVKGQAQAAKRSDRVASEGAVASYIHSTGKIGVLVEVNSETDFVARNDDFQEFVRDVALHIAATPTRSCPRTRCRRSLGGRRSTSTRSRRRTSPSRRDRRNG